MSPDVLIVGGGIGGAALALALGGRGHDICLLEREAAPPTTPRPEILQEATLRALADLGADALLHREAALPIRALELRRGPRTLLAVDEAGLEAAGSRPLSVDAALTRARVLDAAIATGRVTLRRGAEVTNLIREHGRVAGVRGRISGRAFEAHARFIAGDDGARSIVRECLGIRARLRLFPVDFLTLAFERPPSIPVDAACAWIRPEAIRDDLFAALFIPIPGDRVAGVLLASIGVFDARLAPDPDAFWNGLAALTPLADTIRQHIHGPGDLARFRRTYGHADRYVADGAAILGGAAHPMSPAGGQGPNAAIFDAIALADVADAALRAGDLSAQRLAAYERRRRPANRRSLSLTRRAVALLRLGRRFPAGGRALLALLRHAGGGRGLLHLAATAFRA
ncbi:MAG TPA: FAD-dependent monooxygenase [Longimicrobiales bacterium]